MERSNCTHTADVCCCLQCLNYPTIRKASKVVPTSLGEDFTFQACYGSNDTVVDGHSRIGSLPATFRPYNDLTSSDDEKVVNSPAFSGQDESSVLLNPKSVTSGDLSSSEDSERLQISSLNTGTDNSDYQGEFRKPPFNDDATSMGLAGELAPGNMQVMAAESSQESFLPCSLLPPGSSHYEANDENREESSGHSVTDLNLMHTPSNDHVATYQQTCCLQSSQVSGCLRDASQASPTPDKLPRNKLSVKERKRIAVSSCQPPSLTKAMRLWVTKTEYLLDPFREDDDCWLHPSPPPAQNGPNGTQRAYGKLQKRFSWNDKNGKHSIVLNYGIAHKLAGHKMTKKQKDGFINKQWHLSHLCGNWTCLNPTHTTVEPGRYNISRNICFSHRSGCLHNPPCMKDRKISLGVDGNPIDHSIPAEAFVVHIPDEEDNWAQNFDDDDDYTAMDYDLNDISDNYHGDADENNYDTSADGFGDCSGRWAFAKR